MAIKVPKTMVYYSEKDAQSGRLLCWIPRGVYRYVAIDGQALRRLKKNYPTGVEVRVDRQELEVEGIKLPVALDDLIETYRGLQNKGALHESGMILASTLERMTEAASRGETLDSLIEAYSRQPISSPTPVRGKSRRLVRHIADLPEMKGDEESQAVFQRISVRQRDK